MDLSNSFTELPYAHPGRVFRSRMPFDVHDPQGELFQRYLVESIGIVVVLAEDSEMMACTGRNLRSEYAEQGLGVIHIPIPDFDVPGLETLDEAVLVALEGIRAGENLVVHCHAGMGRTGLFLACLAQRALKMDAGESIHWVRRYVPGALETPEQVRFVMDYGGLLC